MIGLKNVRQLFFSFLFYIDITNTCGVFLCFEADLHIESCWVLNLFCGQLLVVSTCITFFTRCFFFFFSPHSSLICYLVLLWMWWASVLSIVVYKSSASGNDSVHKLKLSASLSQMWLLTRSLIVCRRLKIVLFLLDYTFISLSNAKLQFRWVIQIGYVLLIY